jgi:lysophospholipase L1-like esterase
MLRSLALAAASAAVASAHTHGAFTCAVNPELGTHGFPDCIQPGPVTDDLDAMQHSMVCKQRGTADQILIGTIGDSITAGACSSGGNHTYPAQLQIMLDQEAPGKYAVTNLGACGSTMQKSPNGDSPYWQRPQYTTLTQNKWDILVILLGTNDAKDPIDGGPNNWHCGTNDIDMDTCPYVQDYLSMIALAQTLGRDASTPPIIYAMIPVPLMQHGSIGANQTVINSVYPTLIPLISAKAKLTTVPINNFAVMGGVSNWQSVFPSGCTLNSPWPACPWWCDAQHCDQCHPTDDGYTHLAQSVKAGLGL